MRPKYTTSEVFEYIGKLMEEGETKWWILHIIMENYKIDGDEALGLFLGYLAQQEDADD